MSDLTNKVASSGLITIDIENLLVGEEPDMINMSQFLSDDGILREKIFREKVSQYDWSIHKDKNIGIFCSEDLIIQNWAFMILADAVKNISPGIYFGEKDDVLSKIALRKIYALDISEYSNSKVLLKGCGMYNLSPEVYLAFSSRLLPVVQSLMFGEACSSVPVYKKKK